MRNIINFIKRQYFFFLFLLLQVIAFTLIFQNHYYQRSFVINSANAVSGRFYESYARITDYLRLKQINEQLAEEIAQLRHYTKNSFLVNDRQSFTFRDTTYTRQFEYINAKVINNSVFDRSNYLTLNKGSRHGIEPDMGIITSNGVIGIITNVSDNFSSAMSLLHPGVRVSTRHKKSGHLGTLLWEGYDYRNTTMLYIPPHVELNLGDTIETSGFSHLFPESVPIGSITDFHVSRGENFYSVKVNLFEDFNRLNHVSVVKNLMKEELQILEEDSRTTQ